MDSLSDAPIEKVESIGQELDSEDTLQTAEEVYEYMRAAGNELASQVITEKGQAGWQELSDALIQSRPPETWNTLVVLARYMSHAIEGSKLTEPSVDNNVKDSRMMISMMNFAIVGELENTSKSAAQNQAEECLENFFGLYNNFNSEVPFDEYYIDMLYSALFIRASLPLTNASPSEASQLLRDVKDRIKKSKAIETEHFIGFKLLADKLKESEGNLDEMISTADYIIEGLEEDAESAAKLYFYGTLVWHLERSIEAYIENDEYRDKLKKVWKTIVTEGKGYTQPLTEVETRDEVTAVSLETFKPMEVKWEVLPPGELLDHAKEIVEELMEQSGDHEPPVIDPLRLRTLEKVREQWGADNADYMKGALKHRNKVRDGQKECPDQYIVLILQEKGNDGSIVEHAVAESPIAGPHALYVYRQDVNPQLSWRNVMSKNKADARKMGARPIKHPSGLENGELVDLMTERVSVLLTATPEEFLRIEFNGKRIRINKNIAIKAFESLTNAPDVY